MAVIYFIAGKRCHVFRLRRDDVTETDFIF